MEKEKKNPSPKTSAEEKKNSYPQNSSEDKKKAEEVENTSSAQSQLGYSSEQSTNEGLLSNKLSGQYEDLQKTEHKLSEITKKINQLKAELKSIKKVDRKRGLKSSLSPSERKIKKALLKKLEKEETKEKENWQMEYALFSESAYEEIERSKNERFVELGRSGYYAKKYKGSIVYRFKSLLDSVLESEPEELRIFGESIKKAQPELLTQIIMTFIKNNEDNPFLSTFFGTQKSLQPMYTKLILDLMNEWEGKPEYSFKNSEIKLENKKSD